MGYVLFNLIPWIILVSPIVVLGVIALDQMGVLKGSK